VSDYKDEKGGQHPLEQRKGKFTDNYIKERGGKRGEMGGKKK